MYVFIILNNKKCNILFYQKFRTKWSEETLPLLKLVVSSRQMKDSICAKLKMKLASQSLHSTWLSSVCFSFKILLKIYTDKEYLTDEPEIYISEKIIHGPIGDKVEVKCEVKANPRVRLSFRCHLLPCIH